MIAVFGDLSLKSLASWLGGRNHLYQIALVVAEPHRTCLPRPSLAFRLTESNLRTYAWLVHSRVLGSALLVTGLS